MIVARVVLKGEEGLSLLDRPQEADPESLGRYLPSEVAVRRAEAWFEEHGFDVLESELTGLSIQAPKERFETVFRTDLEPVEKEVEVAGRSGGTRTYYRSAGTLQIPPDLTDIVATVLLAEPPDFFP